MQPVMTKSYTIHCGNGETIKIEQSGEEFLISQTGTKNKTAILINREEVQLIVEALEDLDS